MFVSKTFGAMTLVAALTSGTASMALTTDEVWADWQALMADTGTTVAAATEAKDGDNLRLNGVTISGDDGIKITMAEVFLAAESDGSVTITPMDISVDTGSAGGTVAITQEGLAVVVHEDAGGLGYGLMADKFAVAFDTGASTAEEPGMAASGTVQFVDLDGRYERAELAALVHLTAASVDYSVDQKDASLSLDQSQSATMKDMDLSSELTIPAGVDLAKLDNSESFAAALKAGLAFVGEFKQGASESKVEQRGDAFPFTATLKSDGGSAGVDLSVDGAKIGGEVKALSVVVPQGILPVEVSGSADEMSFEFAMPVVATEEAGDYTYQMALKNVVIADAGWDLFDPNKVMERTPADLEIDAGGKLKIDVIDLITSSESGEAPKAMPELQTLDIRTLGLKLAGAAFSGTGAFTFDNSMVAMGGPPLPLGKASVRLEGGNKMIDALVAMGFMSADDASGARVMMSMFGKSAGDDVLTSEIEAKEGGSVFVNGQQIQ